MPLNKGHKNKTIPPKPFKDGLTEAEFENLKKELYYLLSDDFAEMTSNDKLYAIVTNYMNTNAAMLKGKDGLNGVDGKNGYTPRKGIDYFDGDKGDKGDPGEKGEKGAQGLKGEKGDPFTYEDFTAEQLANLKGKDGTNGKDGYTPQKGVDYFTPDDIASLNIPSVDQTYTPTSPNAQSGIAVAEALSGYVMEELNQVKQEILNSLNYDIFGTVNEDNNIIINAALADGTYILKYENQDGTLTEIGTLAVGEETPEPETPITPTSNLFVADTCVLNMRINSSGTLKEQNYTFVTDYIDIGNVMVGGGENKIHFSNFWIYMMTTADINASGGVNNAGSCYRGINYYDKDNNFLGQDTDYYAEPAITDENGDYVITLDATKTDARYIRVCGTLNVALTDTSQLINCEIRLNELIP